MNDLLFIKFAHVVGFAYWLGTDLAVFYTSYYVADSERSRDVRVTLAKVLFALDQVPRMCMTMMLPSGVHLLWRFGLLDVGSVVVLLAWLLGFAWLAMVILIHRVQSTPGKQWLTRIDLALRLALVAGLLGFVSSNIATDSTMPYWANAKLAIFAGLITCGLIIRLRLLAFAPAFARVAQGDTDAANESVLRASLGSTRPLVVLIWAGLLTSAAFGLHLI